MREHLKVALGSRNSSNESNFEFREEYALKERSVLSTAIESSSRIFLDKEVSLDLLSLTGMILGAFCRLQCDSSLEKILAKFNVSAWLNRLEGLNEDVVYFRSSEQLFELALQYGLSRTVGQSFASMVFSFLVDFSGIVADEEALLGLALNFIMKRINGSDYSGLRALSLLLDETSDDRREHLALEKDLLQLLRNRVSFLLDQVKRDVENVPFPKSERPAIDDNFYDDDDEEDEETDAKREWSTYNSTCAGIIHSFERASSDVLAALKSLCTGLPNVLESLAKLPRTASDMAAMASKDASDFEMERQYDEFYELGGAIEILTSIVECPSLRSYVLISDVISALFDVLRIEDGMILALSHLACLLLLDEDRLSWPSDCPTKESVLEDLIRASLAEINCSLEYRSVLHPRVSRHPVSFSSLKEMTKCTRFPEIAVFALWRLALVCQNEFDQGSRYLDNEICLNCLVKDDLTFGAIEELPILAEFPALKSKLVAAAEECRNHEDHND